MNNRFTGVSTEEIRQIIGKMEYDAPVNIYRHLFSFLDLTSLNSTDSEAKIREICNKVNNFSFMFPDLPPVAAICVYPRFVPLLRSMLEVEEVRIASVAASFPSSQTFIENKTL